MNWHVKLKPTLLWCGWLSHWRREKRNYKNSISTFYNCIKLPRRSGKVAVQKVAQSDLDDKLKLTKSRSCS